MNIKWILYKARESRGINIVYGYVEVSIIKEIGNDIALKIHLELYVSLKRCLWLHKRG